MSLLALILIVPPWYHLGRYVIGKIQPEAEPDLRDGLAIGLGFAILSYAVMILALLGGLHKAALWLFVIIPFVATLPLTYRRMRRLPARMRIWASQFAASGDRWLWALIGLLALADIISAGNAAVGWDAAVQHYAFPEVLLREGRLVNVPEIPFSYYPSLGEMLFTLGLGVGGVFTAGGLCWVYMFPLIAGLLSIGRNLGSRRLGLWAALLFLGAPLTFELPFSGVIDLPFLVYCLLSLAVFFETDRPLSTRRLVLIGLLIGCASATKHLGLLYLIAFVPVLIWRIWGTERRPSKAIGLAILVAILALLVPLPWYMRSYLATGNPLFPFLNSLFAQSGAAHGSFSVSSFERTDYPRNLAGYLGYFWHLTMDYWDQRPWFLAIHPAYLAFLPFAIIWAVFPPRTSNGVKWLQILRYLLVLAFLTLTINFFLAPAYPRYLFPTWFCLSLTSAWVLMEILRRWKPVGMVIVPIALLLPFLIVLGMGAKRAIEVLPQYWSEPARVEAIREAFPGYDTFIWANEHLDPGRDKVLSIDPKTYYLKAPAIIAKPGIESPLLVPWDSEPSKILANWRELGATYFVLDTTLLSVKHGFAISFFTDVLDGRDAVWLDIVSTRAGADFYGIGDILTDSEFLYMSKLAGLPVVNDGTIDRHFFTRDDALRFQSWGRDWLMARTVLRFVRAGILREEHRSGPGGGLRIYSIHLPTSDDIALPALPDVTAYCLPYESGPQLDDPNVRDVQ